MMQPGQERLEADRILLIDGAMGTELQRRGVPMDKVAWSGAAVLTHPDVVREIHEEYIRAGARVIITNTFGSTRQMLEPAGYGDRVEEVHRGAVRLARQARENAANQGWPWPVRFRRSRPASIKTRSSTPKRNSRPTGKRPACCRTRAST
jgi:methionine synthase I (cobalamin-dependent)